MVEQDSRRLVAVGPSERDADTGGHGNGAVAQVDRLGEQDAELLCDANRHLRRVHLLEEESELVGPDAAHDHRCSDGGRGAPDHLGDDCVAGAVRRAAGHMCRDIDPDDEHRG